MDASLGGDGAGDFVVPARVPASRYAAFLAIALLGCATDLLTKRLVFSAPALRAGDIWWMWQGHVGIQLSLNEGALFGLGQGGVWFFALLGTAAAVAIPTWLFVYRAAGDAWLTLALGCVMAGVLGNLHDRLGWHGLVWPAATPRAGQAVYAVRDWILWRVNERWSWPNFNVADSLLVIGAGLLFVHAWRKPAGATRASD